MSQVRLQDNVFNRSVRADEPKFKIWSSAGLLLTYWCPSRCACCYVFAGPDAAEDATEMSVETALGCWAAIKRLAGARGKVHITGGEPFSRYDRLREILHRAHWCTDEQVVRDRLVDLKELGLTKLQISTDVYHQEHIPIDRVRLGAKVAAQVLGPQGLQVRWRDFLDAPVLVGDLPAQQRAAAFRTALSHRRERLLGRAAAQLVSLLPSSNYESFAEINCARNLLGAQHVHIDGAGHVFSGTCMGIITAKLFGQEAKSLDELWCGFDWREHPILSVLVRAGPVGLLDLAMPLGYRPSPGYAGKCHLCYEIRRFLYRKGTP